MAHKKKNKSVLYFANLIKNYKEIAITIVLFRSGCSNGIWFFFISIHLVWLMLTTYSYYKPSTLNAISTKEHLQYCRHSVRKDKIKQKRILYKI